MHLKFCSEHFKTRLGAIMDDLCCTTILVVKIPCQLQSYYHSYIYIFACALLKHKTQLFLSDLMSLI
jgi:hypothetical protein